MARALRSRGQRWDEDVSERKRIDKKAMALPNISYFSFPFWYLPIKAQHLSVASHSESSKITEEAGGTRSIGSKRKQQEHNLYIHIASFLYKQFCRNHLQ